MSKNGVKGNHSLLAILILSVTTMSLLGDVIRLSKSLISLRSSYKRSGVWNWRRTCSLSDRRGNCRHGIWYCASNR